MFDSVGWLLGMGPDGWEISGAATLIAPNWVLAMTHCARDLSNVPHTQMRFSTSSRIYDEPPNYAPVQQWFEYPGYDPNPGRGHDLALIHLANPVADVAPAVRFRGTDQVGTHMYMAGYGAPGVWPNEGPFDGVKRAGENIGDSFGGLVVDDNYWLSYFDRFSGKLPLEWQGSNVDSGGGWFADIDGEMQLVGLTAFGRGNAAFTGATRASLYNDWIDETMASVPEPSTFVLLACGGLALVLFRRRFIA